MPETNNLKSLPRGQKGGGFTPQYIISVPFNYVKQYGYLTIFIQHIWGDSWRGKRVS